MTGDADSSHPNWDQRYREGDAPWNSGIRSRELARVLDEGWIAPCPAIELGCGAGTNAVFLAQQGFDVTAVDLSPTAIEAARKKAQETGVDVRWIVGDVTGLDEKLGPFDFVFDRGCFHCVRRNDLAGMLAVLERITRPGSKYLMLAGNANEQSDEGPPRLHEHEIRSDLGAHFEFDFIREMHFEDPGGVDGPLGWSCLMTRRGM